MSGHSKWATIKRSKEAKDAKRSNIFTKLGNNITLAAKEGGKDSAANFKLRLAMEKAKQANMPKDNIERAIKRGTGELKGNIIEEVMYGGLLPGQYLIIIKCLADNKNRTLTDIKTILQKNSGQLAELNSVSWQFENKGVIRNKKLPPEADQPLAEEIRDMEELEMKIIEAGAEDYEINDNDVVVYTRIEDLQGVKEKLEENGIKIESADLEMVAKEKKDLANRDADKVNKILWALDELDDVTSYYTNIR